MTSEPASLTEKQLAAQVLALMPETATLEQISEELAILAALGKGERAAAEGRVVSHEEVKLCPRDGELSHEHRI